MAEAPVLIHRTVTHSRNIWVDTHTHILHLHTIKSHWNIKHEACCPELKRPTLKAVWAFQHRGGVRESRGEAEVEADCLCETFKVLQDEGWDKVQPANSHRSAARRPGTLIQ